MPQLPQIDSVKAPDKIVAQATRARRFPWLNIPFILVVALLVSYGLLTAEQAPLWQTAVLALAVVVIPLASALITKEYTRGRTALKLGAMQPGADRNKPEAAE